MENIATECVIFVDTFHTVECHLVNLVKNMHSYFFDYINDVFQIEYPIINKKNVDNFTSTFEK